MVESDDRPFNLPKSSGLFRSTIKNKTTNQIKRKAQLNHDVKSYKRHNILFSVLKTSLNIISMIVFTIGIKQ